MMVSTKTLCLRLRLSFWSGSLCSRPLILTLARKTLRRLKVLRAIMFLISKIQMKRSLLRILKRRLRKRSRRLTRRRMKKLILNLSHCQRWFQRKVLKTLRRKPRNLKFQRLSPCLPSPNRNLLRSLSSLRPSLRNKSQKSNLSNQKESSRSQKS